MNPKPETRNPKRTLLTGGTGMVGAALAARLVEAGDEVSLLLRPGSSRIRLKALEGRIRVVDGDVRNAASVRSALEQCQPDVVYHLASTPFNPPTASPREHLETIVTGTLNVLEAVRGRPEVRVVATGSCAEYGGGSRLREDQPLAPGTIFGAAKAAAGLLLQTYGRLYGMRTVWLRLFTPYGPWEQPQRLVPHTILSALDGRDVTLTGGSQQRDFIELEDVVDSLVLAAERPLPPGAVFNIGSGVGMSVRELVELILRLMGNPVRPLFGSVSTRADEIMELSADRTAARTQLGWEPRIPLEEGLRKSIAWWTQHRAAGGRGRPMTSCVVCEAMGVRQFLDLGRTALANRFLTSDELTRPEPTYPLRVGWCPGCSHVQLMEHVPPSTMFTDYLYISSASETLTTHLVELSDIVAARRRLGPKDLVIDVGCNDGTLLRGFQRHGVRTLGVDPAKNLAGLTAGTGIERYVGFFNAETAQEIVARGGHASVVTATNTFAHVPQLADFIRGLTTVLAPNGVFVIEAHYLMDLLEQLAFDTIYHEHVSYWALRPLTALFARFGMEVTSAERLPVHHGQLRVFVQRRGSGAVEPGVARLLEAEHQHGLDSFQTYERFAQRVDEIRESLGRTLRQLRAQGRRVVGYGAPAKGNTLLTFLGLGPDAIDYIVDKSPLKQGRYTPGTHIPVVGVERLLVEQPDYVLLLAWNFAEEILGQQAEYRRRGGRFIIPVPEVRVIEEAVACPAPSS